MKKSCLFLITIIMSFQVFAFDAFYDLEWVKKNSPLDNTLSNRQALSQIYKTQGYQLIWFDPEAVEQLESQLSLLHYSEISPFFSYRYLKLKALRQQHLLFEYDLLATDTLISYVSYSKSALNEGNNWYFNGMVELPLTGFSRNDLAFLSNLVSSAALRKYIAMHAPVNFDYYYREVKRLSYLINKKDIEVYQQSGYKKVGDKLSNKHILISRMAAAGLPVEQLDSSNPYFNKPLLDMVKTFQKQHGLNPDGVIGAATIEWLNMPFEERLRIATLNGERSRLIPKNLESFIVVNVPNFKMSFWHDGEAVFRSKVIVGKRTRKTPLLDVKLDSMIINPSWNVPKKLVYKDILPKVKKDHDYLVKNNFRVLKGGYFGEEVDSDSINWNEASLYRNFPYQVRQDSGSKNALGRYKFNTPNSKAIYLHDTPTKYLFDRDTRAFSSGCIRVQNAEQFAETLLKTQGIDTDARQIKAANEKVSIRMNRPIPVKIIYQTAWYQSGYINYREDIYQYDTGVKGLVKNH